MIWQFHLDGYTRVANVLKPETDWIHSFEDS